MAGMAVPVPEGLEGPALEGPEPAGRPRPRPGAAARARCQCPGAGRRTGAAGWPRAGARAATASPSRTRVPEARHMHVTATPKLNISAINFFKN